MSYESEKLAATLKAARERKGLSQRALSARAGVPQSHISKIESGAVNLTVSSLTAIANALDLELALVPRKAASAVRTITRSVNDVPKATPEARREIARLAKQLDHIRSLKIDSPVFENLQRQFREMQQFENLIRNTDSLRSIREALNAVENADGVVALQEASKRMNSFRNALAHGMVDEKRTRLPRPAYRLDGDSNE
ncbi:helix-turn-helix transcriptional regulator [Sulfitobacter sp. KE37]|uniref:helix-turn-helix domain-containing protein n=1 Tax=unclassified Sulfitobacter TaxID=196795 RepID=UPI0023E2D18D|nr:MULTISPECIES: helix-turn-helix domain-containing protein [unclassified Sulfitobacter]MDF3351999.1 helix-turn-helix transcriptional regulator [Sulfitobacter sp. KE12]MDF3355670.1 helix-turn-helix transcriptional regulator [Sulfitobacter sp. KE27]MDF3370351.1 helix-turn-helix transcriptional regulator [Sulfitobacter sp. Ks43]MDF3374002.1 helix-turn-helix transcriptional regulator [Sulfitobacter sp. KS8]MDF3377636.1 helix-turn-helix transcriptional regulator [Sulfitobacter sp. KE37]